MDGAESGAEHLYQVGPGIERKRQQVGSGKRARPEEGQGHHWRSAPRFDDNERSKHRRAEREEQKHSRGPRRARGVDESEGDDAEPCRYECGSRQVEVLWR